MLQRKEVKRRKYQKETKKCKNLGGEWKKIWKRYEKNGNATV